MNNKDNKKLRFHYIDQFRGFIGILMLVGHCSYYFNSIWLQLDPLDPFFPSWSQFALRYVGYLCAPGFLMMAGAMVWWAHQRRLEKGINDWRARWQLIQRGLFLVFLQMTVVNSSWGGFMVFKPWHLGILSTIGFSVIFLIMIVKLKWQYRLSIAIAVLIAHSFLINIPYDQNNTLQRVLMQTFIDAGSFNKYPVLPWFALATLGSVMATGWISIWKTDKQKIFMGLGIAVCIFILATFIRYGRGYGNIFAYSNIGSFSFFIDQKYPPSLFMNLWFFAAIVLGVSIFIAIGKISSKILLIFSIPGKVPLFFYCMHLAILGVFVKRMGFFYREGGVKETFIGVLVMLIIMIPLSIWFYGVKKKSKNYFIRMM